MTCPRCAKENEPGNRFCGRCGLDLEEYEHHPEPAEEQTLYCYRHKKTPTNLRCGRCEQPICTKCTVIGPAGPRCPDCARQNIPLRGRAIAHEAKRTFSSLLRMNPMMIYILVILALTLIGSLRGCMSSNEHRVPQREIQVED